MTNDYAKGRADAIEAVLILLDKHDEVTGLLYDQVKALAQQPQPATTFTQQRLGPSVTSQATADATADHDAIKPEPQPERGCGTCKHHNSEGFSVVVKACRGCGVHPLYPNWQPKESA